METKTTNINVHNLISPADLQKRIETTSNFFKKLFNKQPKLSIVLGSGWGKLGDAISHARGFPYEEIPHFVPPTVAGHSGKLIVGSLNGIEVAVFQGRVHYYEGHPMHQVVHAVRSAAAAGIKNFVLTNAAGGLKAGMKPGDFMVISDHMNLMGNNPLMGPNSEALGPRFPDMTKVWHKGITDLFIETLKAQGVRHSHGVYAALSGPCFETPAEIRMYQKWGVDAVGMSTVPEAIALRHMGCKVGGLSCITNLGAGLADVELSHEDVSHTAKSVENTFITFFETAVARLAESGII